MKDKYSDDDILGITLYVNEKTNKSSTYKMEMPHSRKPSKLDLCLF